MKGRQVIETTRAFTLTELESFMAENWDRPQYNDFMIGRPTPASIEEYILLPATERFMVIVYSRKAGGLFSKKDKVILCVCDTPDGAKEKLLHSIPSKNIFYNLRSMSVTMTSEKERKGPAEEALQKYAEYMRSLLNTAGYTK